LKKFDESLEVKVPEKIDDFTVWKIEFDDENIANLSKVLQEEIEKASSPTLQEKFVELKDKI
jgi:LPS O-antigen subunit length determinant protein (WzzB/FepE family)